MTDKPERVIAAAIRIRALTISLPPPARHSHIMWNIDEFFRSAIPSEAQQGFLTDRGRFVNRSVALEIAQNADQPFLDRDIMNKELYSEDLW